MSKILFGAIHAKTDFDEVLRIKGTQTRIARRGKEWFMLAANLRVIGIAKTKNGIKSQYSNVRYFGPALRLHNIESYNAGRCSKARSKELFDALKRFK